MKSYNLRLKGGAGSGHFGHKGRPGEKGGSLPADAQQAGKYNKLNQRKVHDPSDKPEDLPGIRVKIPNEDGELSHGGTSAHDVYVGLFRDNSENIEENMKILNDRRIASGEYDTVGEESKAQDLYEMVLDDIVNQLYNIADKMKSRGMTPSVQLLIRDYQKINGIKFNKQERVDIADTLSQGSYFAGSQIPD